MGWGGAQFEDFEVVVGGYGLRVEEDDPDVGAYLSLRDSIISTKIAIEIWNATSHRHLTVPSFLLLGMPLTRTWCLNSSSFSTELPGCEPLNSSVSRSIAAELRLWWHVFTVLLSRDL